MNHIPVEVSQREIDSGHLNATVVNVLSDKLSAPIGISRSKKQSPRPATRIIIILPRVSGDLGHHQTKGLWREELAILAVRDVG